MEIYSEDILIGKNMRKKYGNIYNPRYENMKETLKQDINRELSNSNISNKNRASYESMLRKLGD